jgi:hypothetical protein
MFFGLYIHNIGYNQIVNSHVDHLARIKQHYCIFEKVGIDGKWVSKHF